VVYIPTRAMSILEEKLDRGWFSYREFIERLGGAEQALSQLLDLYCQGLLDRREGDEFVVTDAGRRLVEAWRTCGRPSAEPWIDSRVYTMLFASVRAGGRVPEKWVRILEERGFAEGTELTPEAFSVQEALEGSERRLVVTKAMAAAIVSVPEGPAERSAYQTRFFDAMQAMDVVTLSVPNGGFAALTRVGRLLKQAFSELNLGAPYPVLLNRRILGLLEAVERGEEIDSDARKMLGEIGYVSGAGKLTRPAHLVMRAWRYLRERPQTPPAAMSGEEARLLRRIEEAWRKAESNPELAPTRKSIVEELEPEWKLKHYSPGLAIHQLEALGLVEEVYREDLRKTVIELTKFGRELLEAGARECSAVASRVLTEADQGLGFSEEWIDLARSQGLVGTGGPTKLGRCLARVSRLATRNIVLTSLEAQVLKRLPERRSMDRAMIVRSFPKMEEEVEVALDKLESKGLIETLPDGRIVITEPGLLVKSAILAAPSGVATPVTPWIVRLLEAVEKLRTTEDVAALAKEARLSLDELKDALVIARQCRYLGRNALTSEGKALLRAIELLRSVARMEQE